MGMRELVVGYDYSFGHNREGNIELLEEMGQELGFAVHMLDAIHRGETLVSSTTVRKLLREGDVARVRELLARPVSRCGE